MSQFVHWDHYWSWNCFNQSFHKHSIEPHWWWKWLAVACASSLPVAFQWSSSVFQLCKLTLGASISQCGSSGIPVYLWLQWSSSVVCPVASQCTDIIWFGGHWVRSLPSMQPLMNTTGMARVVWAKLISFDLQPQTHKKLWWCSYQRHAQSDAEVLTCFKSRTGIHCRAVNSK